MPPNVVGANVVDAMKFYDGTRLKTLPITTFTKLSANGGLQTQELTRAGFLQGIWLEITGSIASAGGLTNKNPLGLASIIRQVRVRPNAANDIVDIVGASYTYLVEPFIGSMYFGAMGSTYHQGASPVAVGNFKLDMYLPIAMNARDPLGLFNLQNPRTTVNLSVYFAPNSEVATGIDTLDVTINASMDVLDIFSPNVLPPQAYIHQLKDDYLSSNAGQWVYEPELGQKYLSVNHLVLLGSTGAPDDGWTRFQSIVNGSDNWKDDTQELQNMRYHRWYNADRPVGVVTDDFLASTELGTLSGLDRDVFDTGDESAWKHILTVPAAVNVLTLRRQIIAYTAGK